MAEKRGVGPVRLLVVAATLTLANCAGQSYQTDIASVQFGWSALKIVIDAGLPTLSASQAVALAKKEAVVDAEVAALPTAQPTSVTQFCTDAVALVQALPATVLSTSHKDEAAAFLNAAALLATDFQQPAAAATAVAVSANIAKGVTP